MTVSAGHNYVNYVITNKLYNTGVCSCLAMSPTGAKRDEGWGEFLPMVHLGLGKGLGRALP